MKLTLIFSNHFSIKTNRGIFNVESAPICFNMANLYLVYSRGVFRRNNRSCIHIQLIRSFFQFHI
jgi:hypothetical protein